MCRAAANQARSPVPCPGLVPEPIPGSTLEYGYTCGPSSTCGIPQIEEIDGTFLWNQYDFQVPAGYAGVPPGGGVSYTGGPLGHFVVYAGKNLMLGRFGGPVQPVPSYCTADPGPAGVRVHGEPATLYECSDVWDRSSGEIDVGHELLIWRESGVACEVSFHGHSLLNQELDLVVARATVLVQPS
jgi:hypothetical protein